MEHLLQIIQPPGLLYLSALKEPTVSISPNELDGGIKLIVTIWHSHLSVCAKLLMVHCIMVYVFLQLYSKKSPEYKTIAIKIPLRQFFLHYFSAIGR